MLRCFEQKVCNISNMHPNQKIKLNDWFMKIDPPRWMAADFECTNVLFNDNDNDNDKDNDSDHVTETLFVNKPVAIVYNVVKKPDYENLILEKRWLYYILW